MDGDRVLYSGNPGEIEFVIEPYGSVDDRQVEQVDGYVDVTAGGVMIREPIVFGRVFVSDPATDEDLVFVSRHGSKN